MNRVKAAALFTAVILSAQISGAQEAEPENLNLYYRYPMAIGAEFLNWNSLTDYGREYNIYEFAGNLRYPLPRTPLFQPLVRGGFLTRDSLDRDAPERWDHSTWHLGVGIAAINRISRTFELGAEATVGYAYSQFPNVADEPVGYGSAVASFTPRISLLPSFNFGINVTPTARYEYGLGDVSDFDGVSYSIGIGVEYRFGQDPDAPQAEIRSIRISEPAMDSVFAAMQSYYVDNPVGTVTIENTERHELEDVEVSFIQQGYMDSPTPAASIATLAPGETRQINLLASYNSEIFLTEGITPLTGQVVVTYSSRGRPAEQRRSVTYDLHDKTALTWDDDRKMGSFITPADSAVRNYTSFIRQTGRDHTLDTASDALQTAMLAYHALIELGVIYQVDPTSPFTQVQDDVRAVDSVNLPRDTLTRLTGDCDDLTALYATMLETVGIQTAFLTTPGHIYVAFNTGVPAGDYPIVHPDRDMLFVIDRQIWVPVEITMLGRGDFMEAWRYGVDEWHKLDENPDARGFYLTREAQSVYRPVGLRQTDLGLQYGSSGRITAGFTDDFEDLKETIISGMRKRAREQNDERAYNRLGIYAARLARYDEALAAFQRATSIDSSYIDPQVNLGVVRYLEQDYVGALEVFQNAVSAVERSDRVPRSLETKVYINLAKTHYELGQYGEAEELYRRASEVNPEAVSGFDYLVEADSAPGTARASGAATGPPILFADEPSE